MIIQPTNKGCTQHYAQASDSSSWVMMTALLSAGRGASGPVSSDLCPDAAEVTAQGAESAAQATRARLMAALSGGCALSFTGPFTALPSFA